MQGSTIHRTLARLAVTVTAVSVLLAVPLAVAPNQPAPPVRGYDTGGQFQTVDWADGRITLINFWATWCGPCAKEMPFLQGMVDEFGGDGFRVLGIATDKKTDKIMSHLRTLGISYPNLLDTRSVISRAWGGIGILPTSFLVDQDGTVLRRYVGGTEPQLEALKRDVADVLAGRPLGPPPPAYQPPAKPVKADDESDHDHDH